MKVKIRMKMKPLTSVLLTVCILMSMYVPVVYAAPSQTSSAYGNVLQLSTIADATVLGGADVPFSTNGPMSGISHAAGTTIIRVPDTGTYKIDYNTSLTAGVGAQLAVAVNGTVAPSTCIPVLTAVGEVSGSVILPLNTGDVITLRNNSAVPLTMALAPSAGAQMSIAEVSGTVGNAYQWATIADATVVGGADVPFSTNGPMSGISHTPGTTTLMIPNTGTYKIDYNTSLTAGVGAQLAVAVNGTVAPSTCIPVLTAVGEASGSVILPLNAGDVITLCNNSAIALTLALAPSAGAQISITEVSGIVGNAYQWATIADATVVGGADVPFSTNGPMSGIGHTPGTTTLMIPSTGTYKIDYNASITAGLGADLSVAVNGTVAPSTCMPVLTAAGEISGSVILALNAGDVVTLRNNSAIALSLALAPSAGAQMSIVPLSVNPLVITTDSGSAIFVAGDNTLSTPVAIDSGVTVTDLYTSTLSSAAVAITGSFHSGEDVLSFANTNDTLFGNIVGVYNFATGVLTLTSAGATATVAQWQIALESVTYTNTAVTPNNATRVISFTGVDSAGNTSNTATRTVTVTDTDQTPIVVTSGGSAMYPVGGSAVVIDNGIVVSDLDNSTQSSATVSIATGFHSGDTLSFTNTSSSLFGNIVGSYNAATGVLALTSSGATATDAQWANALSSVVFSCSTNASAGDKTISFIVNDGTKSSAAATVIVTVAGQPSITSINPANGSEAGGTSVTITGSGFTGATAVKFGGTTGSGITVVSDTSLTVTSPAGSGTVDVTVTTPNGTSAIVSSDQFSYAASNQDQAAPTGLTGIAPTTAANNDGKITGVDDSMEYRLQGAANYTSVAPLATVVSGLAAGTYQVRYEAGPGLNAGADADVVVPAYTGHEGGGGSSAGGGGTTVTGSVLNGTAGANVANLTATVMTDIHGNYTVSMKAAQTVTCQQPDGTMSTLSDLSKVSYVSAGGSSLGVSADGTIKLLNLAKGTDNHYTITYDFGNGQTMTLGTLEVTVSSGGTVSVTCTLIDPYGIITDAATGKPIAGAKVSLYYANTERNKTNGKTPDTIVALPGIDGFKPNNNQNPQTSDGNGAYGFMVFPYTDYYIAASKDGYESYTSPTISVGQEIVHWDFKMSTPITGVNRLAGQSQVDTALAIAKANYTGTLSNVVLATADNYPDALAGSVLAYKLNAPILLVGSSEADQAKVLDYMKSNLDPSGKVYILGGTVVVSADIEAKVKADGFSQITRLGGTDRYETSVKIAEQLQVKSGTPIVLAYGENYPDALSISSIAAEMQYPILLVQKDEISDVVKNEIAAIKPSKVYFIGGEGVISSAVESQVEQITSLDKTNVVRIAGQDRYDTSLAVAQYFNLAGQSVCVATGSNFPDALAGSVYAANHNTSIIMAGGSLSDQVVNYLKDKKLTGVTLFGGEAVVSKDIEQRLSQLMVK